MAPPTPALTVHHLRIGQGERIPWLLEELSLPYTLTLYTRAPLLSPPPSKPSTPSAPPPAIAEYLIHMHGNGRLALPPTHKDYADYLYWFHFVNATLQPGLFRRALTRGFTGGDEGSADVRWKGNDARARTAIAHVDARLAATDAYLAGSEFTAADVMMLWNFTTMRRFEPVDLRGCEAIQAWVARCTRREAYQRAMARAEPGLDLRENASVGGPGMFEGFAEAMAGGRLGGRGSGSGSGRL
ncbi:glutathione S-transferase [Massariosphaeria phaeospora]|uniref:Glutathione S-transferase n=1 Tax=Massariosphaeria phaeospora TaxID=100035 RepID=A0A7C8I0I9_9PLEO|nr:glutathione S-transferase [Massariosphaeria phaeospora]